MSESNNNKFFEFTNASLLREGSKTTIDSLELLRQQNCECNELSDSETKFEILPPECEYEILVFLYPKNLLLCSQINNRFYNLCELESLWKLQINDKCKEIFKKDTSYDTCKINAKWNTLARKLKPNFKITAFRKGQDVWSYHNKCPTDEQYIDLEQLDLYSDEAKQLELEISNSIELEVSWS